MIDFYRQIPYNNFECALLRSCIEKRRDIPARKESEYPYVFYKG